jgi:hypothetical protein
MTPSICTLTSPPQASGEAKKMQSKVALDLGTSKREQ